MGLLYLFLNLSVRVKLQKVYPFESSETFILAVKITNMHLNTDKKIYKTNTKKINILKAVVTNYALNPSELTDDILYLDYFYSFVVLTD
jgi:hypothetical protein